MTKRICLFAGYHPKNQISDYVVYYVRALAQFADVYYMADCDMPQAQLDKLGPHVKGAWAKRHGKYDFGSWQELIQKLGWDQLAQYDECLFVNDSVFAPLFPLAPIFEKAAAQPQLGAWALNSFEGIYIGSFFFVLRKPVLLSDNFKHFITHVSAQVDVGDVIRNYEKKLPEVITQTGHTYKVWFNGVPSVFNQWKTAIKKGFPVLKIQPFTRRRLYADREWLPRWRQFLTQHTNYPITIIEQHLNSVGVNPQQFDTWGFWLKSIWWWLRRVRHKILRIHFHKDERIVIVFGITILNTEPTGVNRVEEL